MPAGLESTVAFPKSIRIFQLEPLAKLVQMIIRSSCDALTLPRISHEVERIGWENQRKWFCHKLLI